MEIRYLSPEEHGRTREFYEEVFPGDEKAFVDAYYQIKACDNKILAAEKDGELVSMLHRNPYSFRFRGSLVPADYIVAVATRTFCRHQGLMRQLLVKALQDMQAEKYPFAFLMPAAEAIYRPFDFRFMGNEDEEGLAGRTREELEADYDLFVEKDETYRRRHIDWPEWEHTPMMIRLVHLPSFVKYIGAQQPQSLRIFIEDPILRENQGLFNWEFDQTGSRLERMEADWEDWELRVSVADLGSFLCGRIRAEELPAESFGRNTEQIKEKLNGIQVLRRIYINETV